MKYESVMQLIGKLGGTLKFFPSDPDARIGISEEIAEMASDEEQVRWLVGRLPKLFKEWPGMLEVRAVFCSKFKPLDGIGSYSSVYLDGVPSERESLPALPAAATPKQIESAQAYRSAVVPVIADLIRKTDMNRVGEKHTVREIPAVRITEANRITAADIDKAREEYRAKKAVAEVGL